MTGNVLQRTTVDIRKTNNFRRINNKKPRVTATRTSICALQSGKIYIIWLGDTTVRQDLHHMTWWHKQQSGEIYIIWLGGTNNSQARFTSYDSVTQTTVRRDLHHMTWWHKQQSGKIYIIWLSDTNNSPARFTSYDLVTLQSLMTVV